MIQEKLRCKREKKMLRSLWIKFQVYTKIIITIKPVLLQFSTMKTFVRIVHIQKDFPMLVKCFLPIFYVSIAQQFHCSLKLKSLFLCLRLHELHFLRTNRIISGNGWSKCKNRCKPLKWHNCVANAPQTPSSIFQVFVSHSFYQLSIDSSWTIDCSVNDRQQSIECCIAQRLIFDVIKYGLR